MFFVSGSNSLHLPPEVPSLCSIDTGDGSTGERHNNEVDEVEVLKTPWNEGQASGNMVTDVAIVMMCNGRWPERVLTPMLESILVGGQRQNPRSPEVCST